MLSCTGLLCLPAPDSNQSLSKAKAQLRRSGGLPSQFDFRVSVLGGQLPVGRPASTASLRQALLNFPLMSVAGKTQQPYVAFKNIFVFLMVAPCQRRRGDYSENNFCIALFFLAASALQGWLYLPCSTIVIFVSTFPLSPGGRGIGRGGFIFILLMVPLYCGGMDVYSENTPLLHPILLFLLPSPTGGRGGGDTTRNWSGFAFWVLAGCRPLSPVQIRLCEPTRLLIGRPAVQP